MEDNHDSKRLENQPKVILLMLSTLLFLQIAAGSVYDESLGLGTAEQRVFDVKDLLPPDFALRDSIETLINVAPLPPQLQNRIAEVLDGKRPRQEDAVEQTLIIRDLAFLLSKEHLRTLHSTFLSGGNVRKADRHPLWWRISRIIAQSSNTVDLQKSPKGLSRTINEAMTELATAFENLWQGAIYSKSLDYLIRILLRLHLAPDREQRARDRAKAAGEKRRERMIEKMGKPRPLSRKRWLTKVKILCDDFDDALSCHPSGRTSFKIERIIALLSKLHAQEPETILQESLRTLDDRLLSWTSQASGAKLDSQTEEDETLIEDFDGRVLNAGDDDFDEESDDSTVADEEEPSPSSIRGKGCCQG